MRKLLVFNNVTLDGYFSDAAGDLSWAHRQDEEWKAYVADNAKGESVLLLGRVTYELMVRFWPTAQAIELMPAMAERMNNREKVVFSRTLENASWNRTRLVKSDPAAEVRRMKKEPGPSMVLLGSGSIVSLLAQEGLIDEYQVVVNPVVLGKGRSMFDGVQRTLNLKMTRTRTFKNGNVLLCYELEA
jgi:dihydrofolate reductase